jgi:hypothetical protein
MATDYSDSRVSDPAHKRIVSVPLELHESSAIITRFVNNLIVTLDETGYYLSFFEARPPIRITQEQLETTASALKSVPAELICRLYVPKELMPGFVSAMEGMAAKRTEADEAYRQKATAEGKSE